MSRPSSSGSSESFKSFPPTPPRSPLRDQRRMASIPENLRKLEAPPDPETNNSSSATATGTDSSSASTNQRPQTAEEAAAEAGMTSLPLRVPPKSARRFNKHSPSVPAPPPYIQRDAAGVPLPTTVLPSPSAASSEMARLAAKEGWTHDGEPEREFRCLHMLGVDDREWSSDRRRTCRFLTLVIVVLLLLIGLALGLGVGLTRG